MKTLQPGTKVLIEATVELHDTRIDKYAVKTKSGDHVYLVASDLTVCEQQDNPNLLRLAQEAFGKLNPECKLLLLADIKQKIAMTNNPIDLNNFCIDITDPVNAELLPGFKEWFNNHFNLHEEFLGHSNFYGSRWGGPFASFDNWIKNPLTTLPELQKQHPGVFGSKVGYCQDCCSDQVIEPGNTSCNNCLSKNTPQQIEVGDVVRTERFNETWFTELMKPLVGREGVVTNIVCDGIHVLHHGETLTFMWPRSACALVRKGSTPSFKAGQEVEGSNQPFNETNRIVITSRGRYVYKDGATHIIFNDTTGNYEGYDHIRPIPAQPTERCELEEILGNIEYEFQHHRTSASAAKYLPDFIAWHQRHSGRVEVSVPSDEEKQEMYNEVHEAVMEQRIKAAKNEVLTKNQIDLYFSNACSNAADIAVQKLVHFMTRKEQQG